MSSVSDDGRLHLYEWMTARCCRVYYEVLNEQPEFQEALRELAAFVDPYRPLSPLRKPVADVVRPIMEAFALRWGLPTRPGQLPKGQPGGGPYDIADLIWSVGCGRPGDPEPEGKPSLTVGPRVHDAIDIGTQAIQPMRPAPFAYDPTAISDSPEYMTPAELRRRAREIGAATTADIIAQAKAINAKAKAQGWGTWSHRYRQDGVLDRSARRLFLRAVRHLNWEQIAEAENPRSDTEDDLSTDAIRTTVTEWARRLGVALPGD